MSASQTYPQHLQFVSANREGQFGIALNQLHPLQTRMPALADDDVVVHGDAERAGDVDDRLGRLDVRLRRRWIAGGMIVQQTTVRSPALILVDF